jgi:PIN domain
MTNEIKDLPPAMNHVFVDYENVHAVDPAIIGSKTVHVTLLLGAKKTTIDATVVEKLMRHTATVEMIRLTSSGRNALDFILAYYLGRAVLADPRGCFHIVSKDKGYDALIEHLQSRHIRARRYDSFAALTIAGATGLPAANPPSAAPRLRTRAKPRTQPAIRGERTNQVLEHLRMPSTTRPKNRKKLVSFLVAYLGHKITGAEASHLVENLCQAGYLAIGDKGAVTYRL